MRRAALQVFRSARRPGRKSTRTTSHAVGSLRSLSSRRERAAVTALQSSMQLRTFSLALVSVAVASGAFFAYRGSPATGAQHPSRTTVSTSNAYSTYANVGSNTALSEAARVTERRALVVGADQIYTGVIPGDEPLTKETDDHGRKVLEMMTPEQVTQKLRRNEESWLVGRGQGVVRYDVVQIPSNDPIEDDHAEKIIEVPQNVAASMDGKSNTDWMFWGVFDGHSGWVTSAKLRQLLISFVARELSTTYKTAGTDPSLKFPSAEAIDTAIKRGFLLLDHEIVIESVEKANKAKSKGAAEALLAPAKSGSCALLSFYDARSKQLRVACTGDSRAVLGRRTTNGKWTATPLSTDQTGGNVEEANRLRREHPGEPDVISRGRVLGGLEPTRAFGDAIYKWSQKTQEQLRKAFFTRGHSSLLKTPPYVTAEPVVTTTEIDPSKGDFVVMATDGLWEMLSNEEVVGLVGQWLETQADAKSGLMGNGNGNGNGNVQNNSWLKSWFSSQRETGLPVEHANSASAKGGQRAPIRQRQWGSKDGDDRFVVEDRNAATHLVRNALGGKDEDQLCALLTLPSPYSRRYRDDLTVEVIFFSEGENQGTVTLNLDASAVAEDAKAKL
ncbi:protein serine/threonine phosphatase 2C [Pseudovirgaria hyperparasitica]|uniref:Protein serine/threonine phosphatase 2C n=1 Tax=Pseudovirgaria hyperparasitica TaxID=470096 RepID=A0A6A6WBB5_9PEZI|nr:protein serine/threonine phosphatase 2C [Pseudovirgaria hyperparasitica]KAF2759469.1 protein serine/threonine phosphatase 2C [Pseudovirgaria hyperparasitica]